MSAATQPQELPSNTPTEPKVAKLDSGWSGFDKDDEGMENVLNSLDERPENLETALAQVSKQFTDNWEEKKDVIINAILQAAILTTEKLTIYSTLIGLLNKSNNERGGDFISAILDQMKAFQSVPEAQGAFEALLLLLSDLANVSILKPSSLIEYLGQYVSFAESDESCQLILKSWLVSCVGKSLIFAAPACVKDCEEALGHLQRRVCQMLDSAELFNLIQGCSIWNKEFESLKVNCFSSLSSCLKGLAVKQWKETILLRPYDIFSFDSTAMLNSITSEPDFQEFSCLKVSPSHIFFPATTLTIFTHGTLIEKEGEVEAAAENDQEGADKQVELYSESSPERYLLKMILHQIFNSHVHVRKICAAHLLNVKLPSVVPSLNDYIVEVVLEKMMTLPLPSELPISAVSILFELTRQKEAEIYPSIYEAFKFMSNNVDSFNINAIDTFCENFAHYLSNNDYKWIWQSYEPYCEFSVETPKGYFIRELMAQLISSSYHDRLAHEISDEAYVKTQILKPDPLPDLQVLVDKIVGPNFSAANYSFLRGLVSKKHTADEIFKAITQFSLDSTFQLTVLTNIAFDFGHKSQTHFDAASRKFSALFKKLASTSQMQIHMIEMINLICQNHPNLLKISILHLQREGLIDLENILQYFLGTKNYGNLYMKVYWEILHGCLAQERIDREETYTSKIVFLVNQLASIVMPDCSPEQKKLHEFFVYDRIKFMLLKLPVCVDVLPLIATKINEISDKSPDSLILETFKWFSSTLK